MRHLQRALRLPGPPTCSFCGADDAEVVVAGTSAFICADCLGDTVSHLDSTPGSAVCALCGHPLGSRAGLLRRQRRALGLARGGRVACSRCLRDARAVVAGSGRGWP